MGRRAPNIVGAVLIVAWWHEMGWSVEKLSAVFMVKEFNVVSGQLGEVRGQIINGLFCVPYKEIFVLFCFVLKNMDSGELLKRLVSRPISLFFFF